jgi:hypothetical protein
LCYERWFFRDNSKYLLVLLFDMRQFAVVLLKFVKDGFEDVLIASPVHGTFVSKGIFVTSKGCPVSA